MRRFFLTLLGALWLTGCSAPDDSALPDEWPDASPAIWEITSPDGERGWLFGTMHSLPDGVEWRTAQIDRALAEAGVLVVEIANLADTQAGFEAWRSRAYSDGLPPLLERVPPGRRAVLEAFVDKAGGDLGDYATMESWAAALVLASGIRIGDPENGVDRVLLAEDKPVVALESFERQYAMFDQLSQPQQRDLLLAMAFEAQQDHGAALTTAWLTGNEDQLVERANAGLLAYPDLRRVLLDERNARWAGEIAGLVEQGREPFVAVGAAHVIGGSGLVQMFDDRGYAVRRMIE